MTVLHYWCSSGGLWAEGHLGRHDQDGRHTADKSRHSCWVRGGVEGEGGGGSTVGGVEMVHKHYGGKWWQPSLGRFHHLNQHLWMLGELPQMNSIVFLWISTLTYLVPLPQDMCCSERNMHDGITCVYHFPLLLQFSLNSHIWLIATQKTKNLWINWHALSACLLIQRFFVFTKVCIYYWFQNNESYSPKFKSMEFVIPGAQ